MNVISVWLGIAAFSLSGSPEAQNPIDVRVIIWDKPSEKGDGVPCSIIIRNNGPKPIELPKSPDFYNETYIPRRTVDSSHHDYLRSSYPLSYNTILPGKIHVFNIRLSSLNAGKRNHVKELNLSFGFDVYIDGHKKSCIARCYVPLFERKTRIEVSLEDEKSKEHVKSNQKNEKKEVISEEDPFPKAPSTKKDSKQKK